jgi:hypothetical protein
MRRAVDKFGGLLWGGRNRKTLSFTSRVVLCQRSFLEALVRLWGHPTLPEELS